MTASGVRRLAASVTAGSRLRRTPSVIAGTGMRVTTAMVAAGFMLRIALFHVTTPGFGCAPQTFFNGILLLLTHAVPFFLHPGTQGVMTTRGMTMRGMTVASLGLAMMSTVVTAMVAMLLAVIASVMAAWLGMTAMVAVATMAFLGFLNTVCPSFLHALNLCPRFRFFFFAHVVPAFFHPGAERGMTMG